ncbi:hypothetical protein EJ04DRAFT_534423 [Polyplosphaeria fusca]|uniref:Kelch repeat protein n=1 Tax=Polyplosphaeria fusca TaxID=682080 RepID=A0A9P4V484_9PLEO|nr:hypothetical protein EJ04DRAFT_534423 [Polyplosphaeria fusca]
MMFFYLVLWSFSLIGPSIQQKDPLKDFCFLYGHQTTLVDRELYIDGGLGFPQEYILTKNATVPSVNGGILWSDSPNKLFYLYGGEYRDWIPTEFKLWYFDIAYNTWNRSSWGKRPTRLSAIGLTLLGAGVVVEDKMLGFYYGGWLTNNSVPGYGDPTMLSTLLVYDMNNTGFNNRSGPDTVPRAEGVMIYLPAGDGGILVYFGGIQIADNGTTVGVPMSDIFLYDVVNQHWYQETATGDVPEDRRRFCADATWADDRSSYNIYLFGGASIGEGSGYGDVYILSLPSFKWIKFWPRPEDGPGPPRPHHSSTCNIIGRSQMIIMGGTFPNTTECDVPPVFGQHGLLLGKANETV